MRLSIILLWASAALALAGKEPGGTPQWLETPRTPETGAWLTHRIVEAQINDKPAIAQQLMALLRAEKVAVPCAQEGVFFFTKRGPDEKQASIYMRKGLAGTDERLLDAAKVGAKNPTLSIADLSVDGRLLVYGVSEGKSTERVIRVFGKELADSLERAHYNTVSLSPDTSGFWYGKVAPTGTRVFYHRFGEKTETDQLIFGDTYFFEALGPKDSIATAVTRSGRHLILTVRRGSEAKRVDFYAQELAQPDEKIRSIVHGMDNRFSWVSAGEDLYLLTDNEAPKQRVVKLVIDDPHPLKWQTIVPEGEDTLTGIDLVGGKLFVTGANDGRELTRIFSLDGRETGRVISPKAEFAQRVFHVCGDKK